MYFARVNAKSSAMPGSQADDEQDRVFKAIANADRRAILDEIRQAPRTTKDLCAALAHLERTTVMLHLRILEDAGLVIVRREGRLRWNYLDVVPIQGIYNRWISGYASPAADLLARLKADLERLDDGA